MNLIRPVALSVLSISFLSLAACSPAQDEDQQASSAETPFNTSLSMLDLMNAVIEPAADVLWDNAGWIESAAGYEELYPTSDDGWAQVRAMSAMVAETGNLLMLPGRAVDNEAWAVYSQGMIDAGLMAMRATEERNKEDFFQAGAQLYSVCTACHQAYNPDIVSRFVDNSGQ